MFTGIIEEIGTISHIETQKNSLKLIIKANSTLKEIKMGDSVAVNGICLTVTQFTPNTFSVDVMPETFHATSLKQLKPNSKVNLEPALQVGGRLGGHFVSGHVDGTGVILQKETCENAINYYIQLDSELIKYCMPRGSIAVDGTSLTIFDISKNIIKLALIPHTMANSVLGQKQENDTVNIECDLLTKYVYHLFNNQSQKSESKPSVLTPEFLHQNGFI